MTTNPWWKPCLAEFVGTMGLVFVGAGAVVATGGGSLVAAALAHGLVIAAMVIALGHVSGGHFNPAVTVAMLFTKRIGPALGILYILAQMAGGVFGAFLLAASFPLSTWAPLDLGTPAVADVTVAQAVTIEVVLTFFLVFVIFGAAVDNRNRLGTTAGLAIGFAVAMGVLMGGPLTGAAMNPARAFGPALLADAWAHQLVYWLGPILGGIVAGLVYDTAFLQPVRKEPVGSDTRVEPPAEAERVDG